MMSPTPRINPPPPSLPCSAKSVCIHAHFAAERLHWRRPWDHTAGEARSGCMAAHFCILHGFEVHLDPGGYRGYILIHPHPSSSIFIRSSSSILEHVRPNSSCSPNHPHKPSISCLGLQELFYWNQGFKCIYNAPV